MQSIPHLWRWMCLGNLTLPVERTSPRTLFTDTFNYIDISAVDNVSKRVVGRTSLPVDEAPSRARQIVYPRDILVSTVRPGLNNVAIVPTSLSNTIASTGFCVLRARNNILLPEYLFHYVSNELFAQRLVALQKGGAYPAVSDDDVRSVLIPLPPLSEQQRILEILQEAERIRRLSAEADAKIVELNPAIFCEIFGDPVNNPQRWDLEPLSVLINDTPKNGLYKPANLYGEGTPIIRIGDFTGGILRNTRNLQRLRITEEEIDQFSVQNGELLINRVNSIEHLGKSILVTSLTEPTVYESNMMRLTPNKGKVCPEYLIGCLQHGSIVAKLRAKAKKAINQASINQTDVLTLQIPVPPLSLQSKFALQVAQAEELRIAGDQALQIERVLGNALSANAFSGQLTANWRKVNKDQLTPEAHERDTVLSEAGAIIFRAPKMFAEEIKDFLEDPTDGIYSDLSPEQRTLLLNIQRMVGGVKYPRYFTAEALSNYLTEGPLRKNPHAVEGHLSVFAARGLIIPVSREEQSENTGEFVFGNCYRLPLQDYEPSEGEEDQPQIGDRVRLRELERLATMLEKERTLT